jgi:hemoglobin-like flavoprotein
MKLEQIELVKTTYAQVEPMAATAAAIFYGRLFELDPSLRRFFKGSMGDQSIKLMATLSTVIANLDRQANIVGIVRYLGSRHVSYGVQAEHYNTMGLALFWTLRQCLGEAYTANVEEAWKETYYMLAGLMKEAAAELEAASDL